MYVRKTVDTWVLEGNYGFGWEYILTEYTRKEVMLTELFRDKFSSTEDAIPAVLDMAYGNKDLKYVILGDGGITCKV